MFFYQENINRKDSKENLQTLKGTQKLLSVRGIEPGTVKSRHLSCFCTVCLDETGEICQNNEYTGDWKLHCIVRGNKSVVTKSKKQKKQGKKKRVKSRSIRVRWKKMLLSGTQNHCLSVLQ